MKVIARIQLGLHAGRIRGIAQNSVEIHEVIKSATLTDPLVHCLPDPVFQVSGDLRLSNLSPHLHWGDRASDDADIVGVSHFDQFAVALNDVFSTDHLLVRRKSRRRANRCR